MRIINKVEFKNKQDEVIGSIKKTENRIYFFGDICIDIDDKNFYHEKKTDATCPKDIIDLLNTMNNYSEIEIYINSAGGSVAGGMAIYNVLKSHKAYKKVYITGIAGSIATVIACAGDDLYIHENSMFMIHKPSIFFCGWHNSNELNARVNILDKTEETIISIYKHKTKLTEEKLREDMSEETWYTAKEACEAFDITLIEEINQEEIVASAYYGNYKRVPFSIKNKKMNLSNKKTENKEKEKLFKKLNAGIFQ